MKGHTCRGLALSLVGMSLAAGVVGCAKHEEGVEAQQPTAAATPQRTVSPSEVTAAVKSLPEPDRTFLRQAAGANMAAIRFGQLGMEHGASDKVRRVASEMVDTHTRLSDEMRQTARDKGIELPISRMTASQQEIYAKLSRLSGAEFDKQWLESVKNLQQETIKSFQNEAINGRVSELSSLANDSLPALNERVRMVRREMGQL